MLKKILIILGSGLFLLIIILVWLILSVVFMLFAAILSARVSRRDNQPESETPIGLDQQKGSQASSMHIKTATNFTTTGE